VQPKASKVSAAGIPDMRFINRCVPIAEVARALELRLDGAGKIHCWYPERHKNGDRTASVGIRTSNNTVKCFGCNSKPMGPIDFVMDVLRLAAADAALWIAARFKVPTIPPGMRLEEPDRWRGRFGFERGLELLVRSGLYGELSEPARSIATALLALCDKQDPMKQEFLIRISYRGITRFSGVRSPNAIRKSLIELGEIGFLRFPEAGLRCSPGRQASAYIVTPNSDELYELAQAFSAQIRTEIAAERELRTDARREKTRGWRKRPDA
jgi:hypothetical protein